MFACAALVACTNDDIVENNGNNPQTEEMENVPAYITVSIGTTENSGRATVEGDKDGNAEDSGNHNAGSTAENKVSDVLVIIKSLTQSSANASNSGIAKLITVNTENGGNTTITGDVTKSPIYILKEKFRVLAGMHKVLVVVNPTEAIKNDVPNEGEYAKIGEFYDAMLTKTLENALTSVSTDEHFMMINSHEVTTEAKSNNSESSPASAAVNVERLASKITFRPKTPEGGVVNTYPIEFTVALKGFKTITSEDGNTTYAIATDLKGSLVAVEASNLVTGTCNDATKEHTTYVSGLTLGTKVYSYKNNVLGTTPLTPRALNDDTTIPDPDAIYYATKKEDNSWESPKPVFEDHSITKNNWKVELTEYALVNLSKNVYAVRHTANALGTDITPFGYLDGQNYIADANFAEKNAIAGTCDFANFQNWGEADWTTWNDYATKWFDNTLKNVADETATPPTTPVYFSALPTSADMGDNDEGSTTTTNPGKLMKYALENTTVSDMQKHGLTTGIVFKGKLIVPTGDDEKVKMYQYDGLVFEKLNEIIKAYGPGNEKIAELVETSTDAAIKAAGIKIYQDNECYYYTNQLKHFDNGDNNVAGNMEFAIVRNNIYSLAVKNIKSIGDAAIDPNPDTDNESAVGYIQIEAKILPWIVRYNNIEF